MVEASGQVGGELGNSLNPRPELMVLLSRDGGRYG